MRLGIFFPGNVLFDGTRYYTRDYRHYQFSEIARHFSATDFVVFTRFSRDAAGLGLEVIDTSRMNVIGIPGYRDMKPFFTKSGWEKRLLELPYLLLVITKLFLRKRKDWNVLLIFDPYFTNLFLAILTRLFNKPAVFFVGARWDRNVVLSSRYESLDRRFVNYTKSILYRIFIPLVVLCLPTVVTGQEIYNHYYRDGVVLKKIVATVVRREYINREIVLKRGAKDGPVNLIIVCRLTPEKAVETLVQAVALLKGRRVLVRLVVVGPIVFENYYEFLASRICELGVQKQVFFVGAVNNRKELMQHYADADIFVLPSISEGSPKVIPEAMAKGLPIIATRVGGLPELIENGVNGILVEPHDAASLSDAIEYLATNPIMRQSMAKASLDKAEEFTLEVQMERFADFIKDVYYKYWKDAE